MRRSRPVGSPLADLVADAMSPALAAQGFAGREVVARWEEMAGSRLGPRSRPLRIDWPRRRPGAEGEAHEPAVLVVQVESAFAPELQHAAPLILARVNAHLGWSAVGRVALRQGPVAPRRTAPPARPAASPEAEAAVARAAGAIADEGVRDAVTRLGLAVARGRRS